VTAIGFDRYKKLAGRLPMQPSSGAGIARYLQQYGVGLIAAILVVIVAIGNPAFLSSINIANMLSQWAPAGLMAIGTTYVIIAGGFDLSIAAVFSFSAVIAAAVGQQHSFVPALGAAVLAGACIGLVNAALIARFNINPFITTVGTGFVVTGITFVFTKNSAFIVNNSDFGIIGAGRWHGIPYSGMLLLLVLAIAGFLLSRTVYGHVVYAVGGNIEASRLSGLRVPLIVGSTYVILGALTGIAGFISASELSSAQASMDPNILFDVLTIVIVGGTPLGGGVGSIGRTVIGLVLIATITNGFVLLDINPFYQNIIKGALIVGALVMDSILKKVTRGA
jgi:ribose transport system permease protein